MMMAGKMQAARAIPGVKQKREIGVQAILEWAFGRECARIEVDPTARITGQSLPSFGTEYVILQRLALGGVKIDTFRGTSEPHEDAEIVAAMVQGLPVALGGIPMAIRIAELARAGITPDWMPGAVSRCVPKEWRQCKHGQFARTEVVDTVVYRHRGRKVRREVTACPVTYSPSPAQIDMARREYEAWWRALARIRDMLILSKMRDHVVVDVMPPASPLQRRA